MDKECCKNCEYWERHKLNPPEDTPWGECSYWNEKMNEINYCAVFISRGGIDDSICTSC